MSAWMMVGLLVLAAVAGYVVGVLVTIQRTGAAADPYDDDRYGGTE